jgi:hypothetical protein
MAKAFVENWESDVFSPDKKIAKIRPGMSIFL